MAGDSLLRRMDACRFLGFDVWEFSALSVLRPYGRLFLTAVVLRHPRRTLAGVLAYRRRVLPGRLADVTSVQADSRADFLAVLAGTGWIVAMGFCEKPTDPLCPSGRFNHRCWLLEQPVAPALPVPCSQCRIREIAHHALPAGAALYIMTSAEDIARDLLLTSLRKAQMTKAVLSVCPYSVPPLSLAMAICKLCGWVLPYERGDCRDFSAWMRADGGIKEEQTSPSVSAHQRLLSLLNEVAALRAATGRVNARRFLPSGPKYVPAPETSGADSAPKLEILCRQRAYEFSCPAALFWLTISFCGIPVAMLSDRGRLL